MPFKVMIERCEKPACVQTSSIVMHIKKIGWPTFNIEVGSSLDLVGSASVFAHVLRHRLRDGELVYDAQPEMVIMMVVVMLTMMMVVMVMMVMVSW